MQKHLQIIKRILTVSVLALACLARSQQTTAISAMPSGNLGSNDLVMFGKWTGTKFVWNTVSPGQLAATVTAGLDKTIIGNATRDTGTNFNFIFVGDSYTYGVNATHNVNDYPADCAVLPWFKGRGAIYNLGVSGETTAQKLAQFASQVQPLLPASAPTLSGAYVFYCAGINDSNGTTSTLNVAQTISNIQVYANLVVSNGGKFVVTTLPAVATSTAFMPKINEGIFSVTNVFAVADLATWLPNPADTVYFDWIHPTVLGYSIWAINLNSLLMSGASRRANYGSAFGSFYAGMQAASGVISESPFTGAEFSHKNFAGSSSSYGFLQQSSGDTYVNAAPGHQVVIRVGNGAAATVMQIGDYCVKSGIPIDAGRIGDLGSGVFGIGRTNQTGYRGIGVSGTGAIYLNTPNSAIIQNSEKDVARFELNQMFLADNVPLTFKTNSIAQTSANLYATNGQFAFWNSNGVTMYFRTAPPGSTAWKDYPLADPSGNVAATGLTATSATITNGFSMATNYVAANFVPKPGQVIFAASNNWMFAVTVTKTNPFVQIAP